MIHVFRHGCYISAKHLPLHFQDKNLIIEFNCSVSPAFSQWDPLVVLQLGEIDALLNPILLHLQHRIEPIIDRLLPRGERNPQNIHRFLAIDDGALLVGAAYLDKPGFELGPGGFDVTNGIGPVEPLPSEQKTMISFDPNAGNHGRSYIANIDVADR
jgi:hypothetical protein